MHSVLVELVVLLAMLVGAVLGSWCIYWVKVPSTAKRAKWGKRLFVVTLLSLGAIALLAAISQADGLAPLGLLSGFLLVGMLWDGSAMRLSEDGQ
mgnify:CR=1 FL=1